jgi:hypothetical protein
MGDFILDIVLSFLNMHSPPPLAAPDIDVWSLTPAPILAHAIEMGDFILRIDIVLSSTHGMRVLFSPSIYRV